MTVRVWAVAALATVVACSNTSAPVTTPPSVTARADSLDVVIPGYPELSFLTKKNEANTGACNSGGNVSPAIEWSNWPATTKSFALLMSDPDGGRGRGSSYHWIAYNIPLTTTTLPEGTGVAGATGFTQGKNSAGQEHYRGPCPTAGDKAHHYVFGVYALDLEPGTLPAGLDRAGLGTAIADHTVAYTSVVLRYAR